MNRVQERLLHPIYVPINRTAPLCYRFVPDQIQDASLLAECASRRTPEALFPPQNNRARAVKQRYVYAYDRTMMLLQTDGACPNNGRPQARAGAAYVYAPPNPLKPDEDGTSSTTLASTDATNNRADLIAVITALRSRVWWGEGFYTIVVATDLEYIIKGCTDWCRTWEADGWRTSKWKPVKNRDLWEELVWDIEWMRHHGCEVLFWQIPREWNGKADAAAKSAAERDYVAPSLSND